MKTLIVILSSMLLAASFSINAGPHDHATEEGQDGQMMGMMGDPEARSMMMDQIAGNPEMSHEMMQKMMHSMNMDADMDMQKMMSNPEMKARMQKHMEMMQAMLDSEGMDQAKMKEMMDDPEMKSMMKMHMMCAKMMHGGMKGEHSEDEDSNQADDKHSH